IATRYNDVYMLNYNQMWQAHLLLLNGKKQEALPIVRRTLADARRLGNTNLEISSLFMMVGYAGDTTQTALGYLYEAHEVAKKSGDRSLEIYILTNALEVANHLGDKDQIIKVHIELENAMAAEWKKSKKFVSDYVKYHSLQNNNKLLSEKNAR